MRLLLLLINLIFTSVEKTPQKLRSKQAKHIYISSCIGCFSDEEWSDDEKGKGEDDDLEELDEQQLGELLAKEQRARHMGLSQVRKELHRHGYLSVSSLIEHDPTIPTVCTVCRFFFVFFFMCAASTVGRSLRRIRFHVS